ncbi:MAG: hypothetical protein ACXVIW_07895 [Halobacteriota archaeon]
MLESIIDSKACDLGPLHKAEASLEWWGWVIATAARIVEEQQKWGRSRATKLSMRRSVVDSHICLLRGILSSRVSR